MNSVWLRSVCVSFSVLGLFACAGSSDDEAYEPALEAEEEEASEALRRDASRYPASAERYVSCSGVVPGDRFGSVDFARRIPCGDGANRPGGVNDPSDPPSVVYTTGYLGNCNYLLRPSRRGDPANTSRYYCKETNPTTGGLLSLPARPAPFPVMFMTKEGNFIVPRKDGSKLNFTCEYDMPVIVTFGDQSERGC